MTVFHYAITIEDKLMPLRVETEAMQMGSFQSSAIAVKWDAEGRLTDISRVGHDGKVNIKCLQAKSVVSIDASFDGVHIKDPMNEVKKEELLGKGQFSEVWKGRWNDTTVALKRFTAAGCQDSDVKKEFAIQMLALHPNIVHIMAISYRCRAANAMIVMQLINGSKLSADIFEVESPSEILLQKVCLSRDLLSAVTFLHQSRILHLDIKPENVIVESGTKKPYLCDFGLAHIMTGSTISCGTYVPKIGPYKYMGPESYNAVNDNVMSVTSAYDVWSLACTLLEFFSGRSVWPSTINAQLLRKQLEGSDVMPASVEELEPKIKEILKPCFQKEPSRRPSAKYMMDKFSEMITFNPKARSDMTL